MWSIGGSKPVRVRIAGLELAFASGNECRWGKSVEIGSLASLSQEKRGDGGQVRLRG